MLSCSSLRASADFSIWSRVAYCAAKSSRLAWMAAFTFAVRSPTSALYLAFSFSRSETFARTMAMDSFIRGTWSLRSRMFCSRMSSGSSMLLTKKPKKLRMARLKRFHMGMGPRQFGDSRI